MHTTKDKRQPKSIHINEQAVALKAFFKITEKWALTSDQEMVILGVPKSTFYHYKKNKKTSSLSKDTLERISYVLGIYKSLRILLPTEDAANKWIKKSNTAPLFNGKSALDLLMKGHVVDLVDVRRYLDVERGW